MTTTQARNDNRTNPIVVGVAIAFGVVAALLLAALFIGLILFAWVGTDSVSSEPVEQRPVTAVPAD